MREASARSPAEAADDALLFAWATGAPDADDVAARALYGDYDFFHAAYAAMRGTPEVVLASYQEMKPPQHRRYWFFLDVSNVAASPLLADSRIRELLREYGFEAYWRERGWPAQCRPLGPDDFECGGASPP